MKTVNNLYGLIPWQLKILTFFLLSVFIYLISTSPVHAYTPPPPVNPQSTGVGLSGTIKSPPPSTAATISTPSNGQVFTTLPITVQGICQGSLLLKLYDNGVFVGSAQCSNGSFKITTALFNGTNTLIVRDYDALDQQGPDSNTVTVTFNNPNVGSSPGITLTSNFAKLGASPGSVLSWPIAISGGAPPYAISVDWGDGKPTDLLSQASAGTLNIKHTYSSAGTYSILIKVTDTQGNVSYLQLVAVANGSAGQSSSSKLNASTTAPNKGIKLTNQTLYIILFIIFFAFISSFFLGSRHRMAEIRKKLQRGEDL